VGCLGVLAPPPLGHVDSASRRGVTGLGVARERTVREERAPIAVAVAVAIA